MEIRRLYSERTRKRKELKRELKNAGIRAKDRRRAMKYYNALNVLETDGSLVDSKKTLREMSSDDKNIRKQGINKHYKNRKNLAVPLFSGMAVGKSASKSVENKTKLKYAIPGAVISAGLGAAEGYGIAAAEKGILNRRSRLAGEESKDSKRNMQYKRKRDIYDVVDKKMSPEKFSKKWND